MNRRMLILGGGILAWGLMPRLGVAASPNPFLIGAQLIQLRWRLEADDSNLPSDVSSDYLLAETLSYVRQALPNIQVVGRQNFEEIETQIPSKSILKITIRGDLTRMKLESNTSIVGVISLTMERDGAVIQSPTHFQFFVAKDQLEISNALLNAAQAHLERSIIEPLLSYQ